MDEATVVQAYIEELRDVLGEGSYMHQKSTLRSFVKRVELSDKVVTIEYTMPLENEQAAEKEVIDIEQVGSAYGIYQKHPQLVILRTN